jgi:large subunit ribosomal protein L1
LGLRNGFPRTQEWIHFTPQQLNENARAVIETVVRSRPSSVKGVFVRSCTVSLTMSPPVRLDLREFNAN